MARRFLTDDNDVRDALHDAYITVFTTIEHFDYRGPGSLQGWMHRIVVNECITILRRRKTSFVVPLEELPPSQLESLSFTATEAEAADCTAVSPDTLQTLIASLPDGYRTVLNLFAIEGLSHKEIARMLGISESTSASQYSRAKQLLDKRIKQSINLNP